jgi:dolichol-phosphate mannosyltransferase
MATRFLTALPVYNEAGTVNNVLDQVVRYSPEVLVVDDGSTDGTSRLLRARKDVRVVQHGQNRGYGAALRSAFSYAAEHEFDYVVTIDCDGQHEPKLIPAFVAACADVDIVSGSRYLETFAGDSAPPADRRRVNQVITAEINRRLGLSLTDAFCGFKAYRVAALAQLRLTEDGYAMPLELWVQAACKNLRIIELPVPLIYLDAKRSFGGALDDTAKRLEYYRQVLDESMANARKFAPRGSRCAGAVGSSA